MSLNEPSIIRPAQRELDRYVEKLHQTSEYLIALSKYTPKLVDEELDRWLHRSLFGYGPYGFGFPKVTEFGERVGGSIDNLKDPEGGKSFQRFNYRFVSYVASAGNGMRIEFSLRKDHTGYLWMGECNNSASLTIEEPQEAWATWEARRAI